jgi:hypothetical protein
LFQYSEIFNEAASSNYWDSATANAVTSNQTTSPDGAATADLLTTSTTSFDCFVRRTINWVGSTQYSYSIFLKRGPSNHRYVGLYIGAGITGALQYPYFDFDNPTTVQIPSGTMVGTINSTRVDAYPNGWYRVSVTFTTAATPVTIYGGVYVSTSNGTLSSTPTAGLDCYIWGIQAETGAFPTSYIPTTTASVTIHDCRGLLIEESRTNAFQRSDDFGNAYWTKLRSTITSDATTSPSGATDADKLVEDTSSNTHTVFRLVSIGVTTPVSFSVFAKASERSWIQLECGDNFTAGSTAYFNLSNGTIGTVGAGATASIQSMGNGWYRCVVVATPTATTSNGFYVNIATANGTRFYAGDGTSGVFLWGAQVEVGSFPTSYIPTTTGTLARSADVCSITGGNFNNFYNQSEGTMLAGVTAPRGYGSLLQYIYGISASTGTELLAGYRESSRDIRVATLIASVNQTPSLNGGNLTDSSSSKIAIASRQNDFAISQNGSISTTATGLMPSVDRLFIGNRVGTDRAWNGHIASIRYYRKRLPDAKLQALTV